MYVILNVLLLIMAVIYMIGEENIVVSQRKYVATIIVLFSAFLFSMRPADTKDTLGYINNYTNAEQFSNANITVFQKYKGYEIGYIYLMRFFKNITDNYRFLFFFIALTGILLSVCSLKGIVGQLDRTTSNVLESNRDDTYFYFGTILVLYLCGYGMLYNGISLRAGFSMGLSLFAICEALKRKRVVALIYFFLAFLFQRSTAFFLFFAFLILRFFPRQSRKVHACVWVISGLIMFSGLSGIILPYIVSSLQTIILKFGISGYNAFLVTLDNNIGIRDIFYWALYGFLIIICDESNTMQKYLNVVMFGELIVTFLYAVRAVARAYDLFYLFDIPILYKYYNNITQNNNVFTALSRIVVPLLCIMSGMLMLRLSFV